MSDTFDVKAFDAAAMAAFERIIAALYSYNGPKTHAFKVARNMIMLEFVEESKRYHMSLDNAPFLPHEIETRRREDEAEKD